ncbi:unnamed protein product [Closterium sp. NIES-54]
MDLYLWPSGRQRHLLLRQRVQSTPISAENVIKAETQDEIEAETRDETEAETVAAAVVGRRMTLSSMCKRVVSGVRWAFGATQKWNYLAVSKAALVGLVVLLIPMYLTVKGSRFFCRCARKGCCCACRAARRKVLGVSRAASEALKGWQWITQGFMLSTEAAAVAAVAAAIVATEEAEAEAEAAAADVQERGTVFEAARQTTALAVAARVSINQRTLVPRHHLPNVDTVGQLVTAAAAAGCVDKLGGNGEIEPLSAGQLFRPSQLRACAATGAPEVGCHSPVDCLSGTDCIPPADCSSRAEEVAGLSFALLEPPVNWWGLSWEGSAPTMAFPPPVAGIPPQLCASIAALPTAISIRHPHSSHSLPSAAAASPSRFVHHSTASPLSPLLTATSSYRGYSQSSSTAATTAAAAVADGDAIAPTFSGASGAVIPAVEAAGASSFAAVSPLSPGSHDRQSGSTSDATSASAAATALLFRSRKPSLLRPNATNRLECATTRDSSPVFPQNVGAGPKRVSRVSTQTVWAISSVLRLAPSADATRGGKGDDCGRSGEAQRRKSGQAEQRRGEGGARAEDEGSLTDEEEEEGHRRRVRLGKERRLGQPWNLGISTAGQRAFRRLLLGADGERGKAERVLGASAGAEAERQQGRAGNFGRVDRWSRRAQGRAGDGRADGPECGKDGEELGKGEGESSGEISASDIMAILKGLGNKGRWRDAVAVFHWARGCGKIGGSCAEGEEAWRERGNPMVSLEADDLFRALVADGCALDVYAYTAMMSALSRAGRFNDAIALFHSMRADAGVAPSIVTFNVVLAAYARKRGCFHHMASLLQEIRTVGLTPDEYTYNTMISACADAIANEDFGDVPCTAAAVTGPPAGTAAAEAGTVTAAATVTASATVTARSAAAAAAAAAEGGAGSVMVTRAGGKGVGVLPAQEGLPAAAAAAAAADSSSDSSDSDTGYSSSHNTTNNSYSSSSSSSYSVSSSAAQYIQEAERIFSEMRAAGLKPTRVTYNALLDVYGKAGHVALAHSVLESMLEAGVRPNLVTYNEMISACARKGLWREARGIVESMLLGGEAEAEGKAEGGGKAEEKGEGEAAGGAEAKGKGKREGKAMVEAVKIEGGLAVGEGVAGEVVEGRGEGVNSDLILPPKPDVFSYTALIAAYGKGGQVEKVRETYEIMEQQGCFPNLFTFNILLDIYGKNKLFADVAWVMDELAASGIKPDVVTWNTLIRCYGQVQMLPKVEATVEAMRRSGCRPNRRTYNGLIDAFGRCGSAADAAAVFEAMKCAGHTPNTATYIALLAAQSREGLWEEAENTIETMRRTGYAPDALAYSCLIHAYATAGDASRLLDAVSRLEATGKIPRSTSPRCPWEVHKSLVLAFCKCGCVGEAEEALERMRGMGHVPDLVVWNAVLGMYGRLGRVERAERVRGEMRREGMGGDVVTHNVMMSVYGREGMSESVEREFEGMKARGVAPDAVSFSSVVLTLW